MLVFVNVINDFVEVIENGNIVVLINYVVFKCKMIC